MSAESWRESVARHSSSLASNEAIPHDEEEEGRTWRGHVLTKAPCRQVSSLRASN